MFFLEHISKCYNPKMCQSLPFRLLKLSKPKLNHQLNSTEFEDRLHSYTEVHPTTQHTNSVVVVNCPS